MMTKYPNTPRLMKLRLKSAIVLVLLMIGIQQVSAQFVAFDTVPNSTLRINGELKIIANSIVGLNQNIRNDCRTGGGTFFQPNDDYDGGCWNNSYNNTNYLRTFGYIDVDGDASTFNSSSADLILPSGCERVAYAGLYWAASYFGNRDANQDAIYSGLPLPDNRPDFRTLKIRLANTASYVTIPSTQTRVIYDGYRNSPTNPSNVADVDIPYVCYADITAMVQGLADPSGTYTVADMRASIGKAPINSNGISGGWVMVVAYEDPSLSAKYISTSNGYLEIINGQPERTFDYNDFTTLPAPLPVRARYAIATLEGDEPFTGDQFQVDDVNGNPYDVFTTPANPLGNFFDSSITVDGAHVTTRNPASQNTLGFDADIFDIPNPGNTIIGNGQTSARFRTRSDGDKYNIFFNSFQIEIIEPELTVTKRVLDENGVDITGDPVNFADQLFYELTIENQGNEDITTASIRDVLPDNVDFTLGSITTSNPGIVATPNAMNRQIDITIDDALVVRNGGIHTVRFGVSVVATCADLRDACSNQINNVAISTYTGVDSGILKDGEESILEQDSCKRDITGTSNVLINDGICFTESQPAFICTGSLTLTAGAGFASYEWVNANNPGSVIGTNRDLVVTTAGTYVVTETGAPGCQDKQQTFVVDAFNTVQNPMVNIANDLGSNPNVNGNVRTCPITGDPLPEIFLCGAGTTLTVPTPGNTLGFPVGTTVQWQRLDPTDCPAVTRDPNCPTTDSGCDGDWATLSTDINSFTISQAGEYRILATFDGNCTIPFYFNVFQNNFDPDLAVVRQIICGTPGTIRVQNSSLQYEYQLITPITNTVIGYQASPEFTGLTEVGTYAVNVRQVGGLPTACVFQETIFLDELDANETVTPTSPTCPGDQGRIEITVTDSQINYTYIINSTTTAFNDTEGPTTIPNHTFTGLNPDTYDVQVLSADGSCSEPFTVVINDPIAFSATVRLIEDLHCNPGYQPDPTLNDPTHPNFDPTAPPFDPDQFIAIYEVTVTGGSGNFAFNDQADFLGTTLVPITGTTYQFRATAAGNYPVFINDLDSNCTISAGSVDVSPYTAITATATPIDPVCPTDNGSIQVNVTAGSGSPFTYILDQGSAAEVTIGPTVNTSETFNNVDPSGSHTVTVQDRFGCDFEITNITFTTPTAITANISVTDYRCDAFGSSTTPQLAQITISGASGGNGSYEYSIDGVDFSNTTGVFTGLTDGTYTLYIRDTSTAACPVNLGQRTIDPLQEVTDLTFSQTQVQCPALTSDVTVSATGTNGAASFEYRITAPAASATTFSATTVYTLPAGDTYTFEARTTTDGCIYSENYTIDAIDAIVVSSTIVTEPTCVTDTDASFNINVTGIDLTSTTYSYEVTGGTIPVATPITGNTISTTPTLVSGLGAGTYDVLVTDDTTNCTATTQVIIADPAILSFTTTVSDSNCGATSGIITVNATGGRGGYEYELRDTGGVPITAYQSGNTFSGLAAGNYIVAVRDGNTAAACEVTNPVTVGQLTPPTIATAVGGDACYDTTNQATQWITITPSIPAPLGPFTYSLDGGAPVAVVFLPGPAPANTFEIPNLTPGTHSVTVSNTSSNCTSAAINFDINPELTITANLDKDLDCSASPDAVISFTATGGDGTYTFDVIEVGPNTVFLSGVTSPVSINAANTYEIRVTDGLGCVATSSEIIVNPTVVPTATTTITHVVCNGDSSGVVVINPTAGVGPFEARMTSPVAGAFTTNLTFTGLAAGTYDFEIRDAKQCVGTVQAIVTEPILITVTNISVTDYRCDAFGSSTTPQLAQITISGASGGNGSYEYSIDGVDFSNTTGVFTGLTDGTYTLYIRDTSTAACPVNLGQRTIDPLQEVTDLTFSQTQVQCPALTSDVTVSATGTNGAASFEYRITAPAASATTFSATTVYTLPAGDTYTFEARTTTDGCIYSENYTIDAIDAIVVSSTIVTEPTCVTDTDASFNINVTGIDLTSTTYSYEVTGGTIPVATPITGNTISTTPTLVSGLGAGTYDVLVTDDTTNCTATTQVIIADPAILSFTTTVSDSNCGATSGIITVNATGGRGGYEYELRDTGGVPITAYQSGNTFSGLAAGNYIVAVRDGNTAAACEVTNPVTVGQLTPPTIATAVGGDACYDTTNQATQWITITPSIPAPLGPFTYSLDGGAPVAVVFLPGPAPANTFEIPNLTPGTHSVTVSNTSSNCTSAAINFDINPELVVVATRLKNLDCSASPDAQINVVVTGGNGATSLEISTDGGTTFNPYAGVIPFLTTTPGDYQFRVTDSATPIACSDLSDIITIDPAPLPAVLAPTVTNATCSGLADGSVTVNIDTSVGTPPYLISFNGSAFTNTTTYGNLAGTPASGGGTVYNYTIRDAKQCEQTFSATVFEPEPFSLTRVETDITCGVGGNVLGNVSYSSIAGGTPPYTYSLLNIDDTPATTTSGNPVGPTGATSVSFADLDFGDYKLRIVDANGCVHEDFFDIATPAIFSISSSVTGSCFDGVTIQISVSGGTGPFEIREYPGGVFTPLNGLTVTSGTIPERNHAFFNRPFDTPFTFEVVDTSTNCTDIRTLAPPPNPVGTADITGTDTDVSCNGAADGSFAYTVVDYQGTELTYTVFNTNDLATDISGGLTFSAGNPETVISGGTANGTISGFGPGEYLVRVTETDGGVVTPCNSAVIFTITEPTALGITVGTPTVANCNNPAEVTVNGVGGTPPYRFAAVVAGNPAPAVGAYSTNNVLTLNPGAGPAFDLNWEIYILDANDCAVLPPTALAITRTADPVFTTVPAFVDDACNFDNSYTFRVVATGASQLEFGIDDGDTGTSDSPIFGNGTPTGNPNEYEFTYTVTGPSVDEYTLIVRDVNGCEDQDRMIVYPELLVTATFTDPTCRASDATIVATVSGGSATSGNWTFSLVDAGTGTPIVGVTQAVGVPGANDVTFSNVPPGDHRVEVVDSAIGPAPGCEATFDITIPTFLDPIPMGTPTPVSCFNGTDGTILVSLDTSADDNPPYTYELFPFGGGPSIAGPQSNPLFENLSAGNYEVVATSDKGCSGTSTQITITEPAAALNVTNSQTAYGCNASNADVFPVITLTITGGTPDYDVSYSGGASGSETDVADADGNPANGVQYEITATVAGTYTISVTDENNCAFANFDVIVPAFPIMTDPTITRDTAAVNNGVISCDNLETVTVSITGGTGPFDFVELGGAVVSQTVAAGTGDTAAPGVQTTATFALPSVGSYTFRITDQGTGCSIDTAPYEIVPFDTITATLTTVTDILCNGATTGALELNIGGYTGAYNYTVINTVTGTNVPGYINVAANTTTNPEPITGLPAGTFEVSVEALDAPFCDEVSNTATIDQPAPLTLNFLSATTPDCNTAFSTVTMDANGGVPGYSFAAVDGSAPQPDPGVYSLTEVFDLDPSIATTWVIFVQDGNNCVVSREITIPPVTPAPVINTIDPFVADACTFDNDYTFRVTATSNVPVPPGTGSLTYQLDGGAQVSGNISNTEHEFTVSGPGTYSVVVFDENGCPSLPRTITVYPELLVTATFTDPTCRASDATIVATVSGGSATSGNWTFSLVDAGTGTPIVGVTQAVGVPGANDVTFSNVPPGDHRVEVVDSAIGPAPGCEATFDITIPTFLDPIPMGTPTPVSCFNGTDGTILVSLDTSADDNPPYTYELFPFGGGPSIAGPQSNPLFENLSAGNYEVVATSDKGCSGTSTQITITEPAAALNVTNSQTAYGCNASNADVFPVITLTITGGTPDYDVSYSGGASGSETDVADADGNPANGVQYEITATVAGTYTISVTDENNCAFANFDVIVPAFPIMTDPTITRDTAAVNNGVISCDNLETVTVSITGGTGPFDFVELGGAVVSQTVAAGTGDTAAPGVQTTATFALPSVGSYTFRITDQGTGCSIDTAPYEIVPFDTITATLTTVTDILCNGATTGALELNIGGYTGAYNYTVINTVTGTNVPGYINVAANTTTNPEPITGLPAGTFEVSVEALDAPFCDEVSNRVNIASPPAIIVTLDQKQDETCNPGDDASIEVVVNGGTPPFRYQLESEDSGGVISIQVPFQTTTTIFTGLDANNTTTNVLYRVRVLDANDCPSEATIVINPPVPLGLDPIAPTLLACFDSEDGTITATASGGQGPGTYFFMLTFPDGSQSTAVLSNTDTFQWNDLKPGNYIVTVTDNLACEIAQDPVIINAPPAVTIDVTPGPISCLTPPSPNPITVTAGGGTPGGYEFSSDGVTFVAGNLTPTTHEFTLPAGDYNFYVRDANGCVSPASNTIPVRDPVPLSTILDLSNTSIVCFGEPTGSIDASVTGGLGNYGYRVTGTDYLGNTVTLPGPLATDTQTTSFFGDLPAGNYTYTVTSGDCVDSVTSFEIRQPVEFIAQALATPISCNGETDGTIRVTATGGTWPQYFFSLYNSAGNAVFTFIEDDSDGIDFEHTFTDLPADTYRVEVEDANGCPRTIIDIQIIEPAPILASVNATTPEDCAGDMNGTATLSITGGLPPANPADPSYFWSIDGVTYQAVTDPSNLFIDNLPGGTTTVFIRDSQNNANCQGAFNIDIEPGVNLAAELVPELVCPVFDYSDPMNPVMTSEEQYFVSFDIVEESQGLGIIYTLNGINGTPNPPNNSNLTGNFEVTPGEYEGVMEYQGCTRTVDTIEILEYTPLAIPVAQMTNNPQDPNEYQIIASGGRPFENTPFYAFSFTMLEEGMTLDQLEPSDYTELDGNIFVIRQTADYVLRVVDADGCEVLTVQNLTYINIRIPNYFTPDSPNSTAEERFWYPRQITPNVDDPFFFENMEVIVFDRYGRMLAEFKGDQQGWDGQYQGKQLPSGDYWYSIILNDVDNREFTGHFTLYR